MAATKKLETKKMINIEVHKMKIITLKGERHAGKTTTIRKVYQTLWYDEKNTVRIAFETDGGDKCDFISILNWKNKIIVIKSLGDAGRKNDFSWIKNGWEIANAVNADVLLNALDTDDLDEKKYCDYIKPSIPIFFPIEKKETVGEMVLQEETLCTQILDELEK